VGKKNAIALTSLQKGWKNSKSFAGNWFHSSSVRGNPVNAEWKGHIFFMTPELERMEAFFFALE